MNLNTLIEEARITLGETQSTIVILRASTSAQLGQTIREFEDRAHFQSGRLAGLKEALAVMTVPND